MPNKMIALLISVLFAGCAVHKPSPPTVQKAQPEEQVRVDLNKHSSDATIATLRGIKKLRVAIKYFSSEIESAGLTRAQIESDTELKLREAGIEVAKPYTKDVPYLYVKHNISKEIESYIYNISVEVCQPVTLKRNRAIKLLPACTWSAGGVGMTDDPNDIRDKIAGYVDSFAEASLSANQK